MIRVSEQTLTLGMICACVDRVDFSPLGSQCCDNLILHGLEFGPAIITSANSGLVRYHHDRNFSLVRGRDDLRSAWNNDGIFGVAQIFILFDNGPVAIQKQGRAATGRLLENLAPYSLRSERVFDRRR